MYAPEKPYKNRILRLIKTTWNTPYLSVKDGVYPVFERKLNYPEVDHTDGIGTKGIYHWNKGAFRNAVLDALAMNLNDLAMARATPYKLQCHIVLPEDNKRAILAVIRNLVVECKKRQIAITGGETSIQNHVRGLDIGLTVSGFVKKKRENRFHVGDTLVGLASSGLHSNGFTKARELFGNTFFPELMKPTTIYWEKLLALDDKYDIHGMMHITGGAYTKLKGLLNGANAIITNNHALKPQAIYKKLYSHNVSDRDMYRTFNCGIGFVLSTSGEDAQKIVSQIQGADIIGKIILGTNQIHITSAFSGKKIKF